jgi:hypothetical protein
LSLSGIFFSGISNLGHLERVLSNHRQVILPQVICGKQFLYLSLCSHDSECHFTDSSFPQSFKDTTVSMPLMDNDDYFVREGTLTWEGAAVTFEVSAEQFDLYIAQF